MKISVKHLMGAACLLAAGTAQVSAEEIKVMTSGGFTAAYQKLGPAFATAHGDTLTTILGPSMGKAPEAIPNRLDRGEQADVVIMVGYALDELIKQGKIEPGSRVELADSRIGAVVRAGAPRVSVGTPEALRETLLHARSIAYSDSASGVYVQNELFAKLGVADQVKPKSKMIEKTPVASVVAKGDYELGFQQVSELLPVKGATFVGKIPESLQSVTRFAGAVPKGAAHAAEARALLQYLASPAVQPTVRATGLDSVSAQ
ncbi:substrate-binding domain-containing protein [Chitinasiproducens palmae]|uniref:Molybdate transport system substrate-binding protein n=1 Tax=Chitinasiproducens palmae TaxID=1770053 RepID=A0A1H2PLK3_9BURK|nr:substrate-binding domain-containing protein [Chitinasiproducens palmae]SDV47365.1 molybdate transport system substrate-binding protein [Chitinasiproducens palmae]